MSGRNPRYTQRHPDQPTTHSRPPVPPHARPRLPLVPARPLSEQERTQAYWQQNGTRRLTAAQLARIDHKARHATARPARLRRTAEARAGAAERRAANWLAQIMGRRG